LWTNSFLFRDQRIEQFIRNVEFGLIDFEFSGCGLFITDYASLLFWLWMLYTNNRVNNVIEHNIQFKNLARYFTTYYCQTRGTKFNNNESINIVKSMGILLFMESASTDRWCDTSQHINLQSNELCLCKKWLRSIAANLILGIIKLPQIFDFLSDFLI